MAQTCALIASVQPILHRVSCSNKTLTNAPKHYETHKYMSLGSNGVDRVCSLRKNTIRFRTTNFCIYVQPVLYQVLCSNERLPNAPKHYETHQNMSLGSNWVDRVDSRQKIPMRIRGMNICINCFSSACFAPSFMQ